MSIVRLSKVAATFACGLLALCLALQLWQAYVLAPWTRDGRVSAQVIRIAPEVSGSVEAVFVADNQRGIGTFEFLVDEERPGRF
ncbi:hypothetical protein ACLBTQ_29135, partial [Pseudomonas aeruginosa]